MLPTQNPLPLRLTSPPLVINIPKMIPIVEMENIIDGVVGSLVLGEGIDWESLPNRWLSLHKKKPSGTSTAIFLSNPPFGGSGGCSKFTYSRA